MVKWWQPVVLAFLLAGIGGFVSYGLSNKPLVDYTLEAPSFWNFTLLFVAPQNVPSMTFSVKVRNRGLTDSLVNVTVIAWNASIASKETDAFSASLSRVTWLSARSDDWGLLTFYLRPVKDTPSFTISCTVTKVANYSSFSAVVSTTFAEITPLWPTTVTYVNNGAYQYQRMD